MFDRPLAEAAAEDVRNEEGYVAAWARPGTTPLRCKIKYSNYVRLHRLLTGTNAVTVWEMLRDKLDVAELTTDVPDEFRAWIDAMLERFTSGFKSIEDAARAAMEAYPGWARVCGRGAEEGVRAVGVAGAGGAGAGIVCDEQWEEL